MCCKSRSYDKALSYFRQDNSYYMPLDIMLDKMGLCQELYNVICYKEINEYAFAIVTA